MVIRGSALRTQLGRLRRRLRQFRPGALPPPGWLAEQPDLRGYRIGRYTWGHLRVTSRTEECRLEIGQFCSFARGCHILLGGEHRMDFVSTFRFPVHPPFREHFSDRVADGSVTRGDVTIGNDVWIGDDCTILSGVTLGDGVVVGAGSVVRQSAPPYAIVVGNPARVAGFRFPADQIEALLRIQWWDWSEEQLLGAMDQILSQDVQAFIDAHDVRADGSR